MRQWRGAREGGRAKENDWWERLREERKRKKRKEKKRKEKQKRRKERRSN